MALRATTYCKILRLEVQHVDLNHVVLLACKCHGSDHDQCQFNMQVSNFPITEKVHESVINHIENIGRNC